MTTATATSICPDCGSNMHYGKIESMTLGPDGEPSYYTTNGMVCELCGTNDDSYTPDEPDNYDDLD